MAYGLPALGEANWKGKLDASIEAVKTTADAALPAAQKGAASGVAPLDAGSRVPEANLPANLAEAALSATFEQVLRANFDGTNETTTLQAALTAAAGGTLRIPSGKTIKTGTVTIPANTRLTGGGTIDLIDDGTSSSTRIVIDGVSGVTIDNLRILQSNATGRTSVRGLIDVTGASNCRIVNNTFGKASSAFIILLSSSDGLTNSSDILIAGNRCSGAYADGIHVSRGSSRVTISDNLIDTTGDDAIAVNSLQADGAVNHPTCTDILITGNRVRNVTPNGSGIAIYGGSRITVSHNQVDGTPNYGIAVQQLTTPADATFGVSDVTIVGNQVRNTLASCIWVNGLAGSHFTNVTVANNWTSPGATTSGRNGCWLVYVDGGVVSGNTVTVGAIGLRFLNCTDLNVTGNLTGGLADTGIYLDACSSVAVTGNSSTGNNGGLYEPNGGPNLIVGNVIRDNTAFQINNAGVGTVVASNL